MGRVLRRGRVTDADSRGVADALVSVVWGTAPTPDIGRRTDGSGTFQVGLPDGRFRLCARTESGLAGEAEVEGGEGGDIEIRIGESPRRSTAGE